MIIRFLRRNRKQRTLKKRIEEIPYEDRVLLISHCLRPSSLCKAKFGNHGLMCSNDCPNNCTIGRLRKTAEKLGYKGICIAPGGKMAIKFVKEMQPAGIVAIACKKELEEGIEATIEIAKKNGSNNHIPLIATVPLVKDGCVDTEVNIEIARRIVESCLIENYLMVEEL